MFTKENVICNHRMVRVWKITLLSDLTFAIYHLNWYSDNFVTIIYLNQEINNFLISRQSYNNLTLSLSNYHIGKIRLFG
jgi:hypothetical protein